jgi:hypothetical protein
VTQQEVAERLGKTQGAVSWTVTQRSALTPLDRKELKRWLVESEARTQIEDAGGEEAKRAFDEFVASIERNAETLVTAFDAWLGRQP